MSELTVSEGLAQGPYVAAGEGFDLATLRMEGSELTTEPPHPQVLTLTFMLFYVARSNKDYNGRYDRREGSR